LANTGSLIVRAFIDINGNYIYDEGEELVEGLKFLSKQSASVSHTNEQGIAQLLNLHALKTTDIELDLDSIKDPFLLPALAGVAVTPRAAFVDLIDFPLLNGGEIDGVAYIQNTEKEIKPATYLTLNLFNDKDQLIDSVRTEFDGFFLFTQVKPGQYYIEPDERDMQKNGLMKKGTSKRLDIDHSGTVISNENITFLQLNRLDFFLLMFLKYIQT